LGTPSSSHCSPPPSQGGSPGTGIGGHYSGGGKLPFPLVYGVLYASPPPPGKPYY